MMIRTLVVDDHPAVSCGLVSALRAEPGLLPVATATGFSSALLEAERQRPDLALVDYQLEEGNGLAICYRLKQLPSAPRALIYSGFAADELALGAAVAGADGIIEKGAPLEDLFRGIRTVIRGGKALPALRPELVEQVVKRLEPRDLPILGMRVDGAAPVEIASVLGEKEGEVSHRVMALIGRLTEVVAPS